MKRTRSTKVSAGKRCAATLLLASFAGAVSLPAEVQPASVVSDEQRRRMEKAVPAKAQAKPARNRKLLVVTLYTKDRHASIPHAELALELLGRRTGAYEPVFSNDLEMFRRENLKQFDAICFANTAGVITADEDLRQSLLEFVANGKGFVGFHSAAATFVQYPRFNQFPAFGEMLGGYENGGHPWGPQDTVTVKVEDRKHPLNAAFPDGFFQVSDEIYQFQEPYSRERLRVLLSIDTERTDMGAHRRFLPARAKDRDFPISWIRRHGKGRVFYSSLGHNPDIFGHPQLMKHFLAGIQYALGDLKADDRPSVRAGKK